MICSGCNLDRLKKDFFTGQIKCYKCMYRDKLGKNCKKKLICKMCKLEFVVPSGTGKKQRDVYCSQECANKGHKIQLSTHWTKVLRSSHPLK